MCPSQAVSLQCWCEPPAVCVLCGGAPPRSPSEKEKGLWMRQTWLDMSVHPFLSMPSGEICIFSLYNLKIICFLCKHIIVYI